MASPSHTEFHPDVGVAMLKAWQASSASAAPQVIDGSQAKQGLLALLSKAELHAAAAGFASPITGSSGAGVQAYVIGGSTYAAKTLAAQGNQDAIVYLAAQQAARRANAEIVRASDAVAYTIDPASLDAALASAAGGPGGLVPVVAPIVIAAIVIAVVAVAAAVAVVAWSSAQKVTVQQQTQQRIALADQALDAASSGKKLDPAYWKVLQQMAGAEQSDAAGSGGIPWGLLLVGGGALAAYKLIAKE